MTLAFTCPHCGKIHSPIPPELQGKKARCACGNVIRIAATTMPRLVPDQPTVGILESGRPTDADAIDGDENDWERDEMLDQQYGDLDHILAAARFKPNETATARAGSDFREEVEEKTRAVDKDVAGAVPLIFLYLAILSCVIALIWGSWLVATLVDAGNPEEFSQLAKPFSWLDPSPLDAEEGQGGLPFFFWILRWPLLIVVFFWIGLALMQVSSELLRRWHVRFRIPSGDGWLGTASVVMAFLMLGILAVHELNYSRQSRKLNRLDSPSAVLAEQSAIPQIQRLRELYQTQLATNRRVVLFNILVPMAVFAIAMVRIWIRTKGPAARPIAFDDW